MPAIYLLTDWDRAYVGRALDPHVRFHRHPALERFEDPTQVQCHILEFCDWLVSAEKETAWKQDLRKSGMLPVWRADVEGPGPIFNGPHSSQTRKVLSSKVRNLWRDKEYRSLQIRQHTGHVQSEGTKRKRSLALLGNTNGLGYRHTEDARKRIGQASRGNQYCLGKPPWNKGLIGVQAAWNKGIKGSTQKRNTV